MTLDDVVPRRLLYGIAAGVLLLAILAARHYPGNVGVYALFTVFANGLVVFGLRKHAMFFDLFIAAFLWLGFWLKASVRLAFYEGRFFEATGHFDGSGAAFDRALLIACTAFAALMLASWVRERFLFRGAGMPSDGETALQRFYERHRRVTWIAFATVVVAVAVTNFRLGVYQRGVVARTVLPFGLNAIYSWLLLFGLASVSALLLHFEFIVRRRISFAAAGLTLLEAFLSSVSLLSRGMVLNVAALAYGLARAAARRRVGLGAKFWLLSGCAFVFLFASSVALVHYARLNDLSEISFAKIVRANRSLPAPFLDRWVGIEGVMAVSSYADLGWDTWKRAWREKLSSELSFYDTTFIESPYLDSDRNKHNYVSLPGVVAFCFYPGSFSFLFVCIFALAVLAAGIERSAFHLGGGNAVLCALIALVVASRYAHFGYAPAHSYALLGAIYLNLALIYFSNKLLVHAEKKRG